MKIALVHDYLSQDGGAERVLRAFHEIWPEAPIFVLFEQKGKVAGFDNAKIKESFLSYLPFGRTKYQWYLPFMPLAVEKYQLHDFDVVLSSTSAFAKGVLTRPGALHISYCHTPTRYLWTDTHEYIADLSYNRVIKSFLPPLLHRLRLWDKMSVDRVDHFIANSDTVRARIQKYYRRDSDIIYPPVSTNHFFVSPQVGDYYVTGGRMVPYKRFDLVVRVFNRLGWKLKVFGDGPALNELKKIAKPNIEFIGRVSDTDKAALMSGARAFIHPQVEDLGITALEAMAAGRPVIAYGVGGATETVIPQKTGLLFYEQNWDVLYQTLRDFDYTAWDSQVIRAWAERFDEKRFKDLIKQYVTDKYARHTMSQAQCRLQVRY